MFQDISNSVLHEKTKELVAQERRISLRVLEHFREIEHRMLYAEMGYPDLYQYAREELKYSEYEAYHRIQAMRALRDLPEAAKDSFTAGKVNATTLAQLQNHSRRESLTPAAKLELFEAIQDKSRREVKQILGVRPEDQEFDELFTKMKALYSHKLPHASLKELFVELAKEKLRTVSGPVRRCTYRDPHTGRACESEFFLEKDHILPKALGGGNEKSNLRDYCRTHNQLAAINVYGRAKMVQYLPKLR